MDKKKKYLFYVGHNYSFAILRPLQAEILRQGHQVRWFFRGKDANQDYLLANEKTLETIRDIYRYKPDAVFAPGNIIPSIIPGIKVALFHGFNVGKRSDEKGHFNIRGWFDLYCTQGPNTTEKFQQLAQKHGFFNVVETGWCMLDPLFNSSLNHSHNKQPQQNVSADKPKTVLMCSTFTPRLSCAHVLYDKIRELRDTQDWRWLIQFHPKMDKDVVSRFKGLQNDKLTFVETDDVLPLLSRADVMLCDTSSILLMFLLQNRPVVTFRNNRPGDHLFNITEIDEVGPAIEQALTRPDSLMHNIAAFNQQLHPYYDGQSSQRVLKATNELIDSKRGNLKRKPLNVINNVKQLYKLMKKF